MDLVIFGAQGIALGAYEAIHRLYPQRPVRCFLVTSRGKNADSLFGIPVYELDAYANTLSAQEKEKTEVLVATPENMMDEIEDELERQGFFCHVRLTSGRWAQLMGYFYVFGGQFRPLSVLPVGYHKAVLHVYMAKFYRDKPLAGDYVIPAWVLPVQAGAALCSERVAELLDCIGENISNKNGNYSELTVLYWIWKNCLLSSAKNPSDAYYGLVHYRRILDLSEDDLFRLTDNGVDVVLPYPMPYEPDMEEHHRRYLKTEDWNAVIRAVGEISPDYAKLFGRILRQRYLYNYNIVLAKKDVLRDYCEWLFPILERVEELSVPAGFNRHDRYIGYIGETMMTLYFMANRNKLNIMHTGCRFLA